MSQEKDLLTTAKEIFLTDVDEELLKENTEIINSWERDLRENEAYVEWQEHDITRSITRQAKDAYKEASVKLMFNRSLTEAERNKLYATQDACSFILSLTDKKAKEVLNVLQNDIKKSIQDFS